MLVRVWKVSLVPTKIAELESFAKNISLPMFRKQHGCLAVFFTRTETECATITVWDSEQSVKEMDSSSLYQQVVQQIEQSGILGDDHQTQVFLVYGSFLSDEFSGFITSQFG